MSATRLRSSEAPVVIAPKTICSATRPPEQHGHVVQQLLARLQVAVLGGQVQRVAERASARDDRDPVDAVHRGEQLAAERVPGLVEGHHPLLVGVEHALGLYPGDHPLDRRVEVGDRDRPSASAGGEDRGLVADVREVGSRQPARLLGHEREVHVVQGLVAGVHLQHAETASDVGRDDEHLAVEAAGTQQRRIELLEQVRGRDHDHASAGVEAVHLHQQLVERLVLLARDVRPAPAPHGVELVDEDDRRFMLARDREQPADARRAQPGEHLDERGGGLREELGARLVGHGLGQQRLAGARRPVQEDALGHLRAQRLKRSGVAQELHDLLQLGLRLVHTCDVLEGDRLVGGRLDLLRLDARHDLQRAPHQQDQRGEEEDRDDRLPGHREVLDFLRERGLRRGGHRHERSRLRGRGTGHDDAPGGAPGDVHGARARRRRLARARLRRRRLGLPAHSLIPSSIGTILGIVVVALCEIEGPLSNRDRRRPHSRGPPGASGTIRPPPPGARQASRRRARSA